MDHQFKFYLGACAVALGLLLPFAPAYAGFEFVAPIDNAPLSTKAPEAEASIEDPLLPLMKKSSEALDVLPKTMKSDILPDSNVSRSSINKNKVINVKTSTVSDAMIDAPMQKSVAKVLPKKMPVKSSIETDLPPVSSAKVMQQNFDVVQGFGSDIPLVVALRQVVPASYQYAFADGVEAGKKVNWQGGKPWNEVVQDMLAPHNMSANIGDNVIQVKTGLGMVVSSQMADKSTQLNGDSGLPLPLFGGAAPASDVLFQDLGKPAPVQAVVQRKRPALVTSDRLDLADLSIGAPMQLTSGNGNAGVKSILAQPRTIEVKRRSDKVRTASMSLDPVTDKKIIVDPDAVERLEQAKLESRQPSSVLGDYDYTNVYANWNAERGTTLRTVLQKWSDEIGVSLVWDAIFDYPLQTDIEMSGSYEEAISALLEGFSAAEPRPVGHLYQNAPAGSPVLIVKNDTLIN